MSPNFLANPKHVPKEPVNRGKNTDPDLKDVVNFDSKFGPISFSETPSLYLRALNTPGDSLKPRD